MCSIKVEDCEVKTTIAQVELRCGGTDVLLPGANLKKTDSGPSTPKTTRSTLAIPVKKEEEDDPLTYLVELFGHTTLDEYEDSDSGSGSEEDDVTPPASPPSKGFDKVFFYVSTRVYYYNCINRNVYAEDGTLVHDNTFVLQSKELFGPEFYIEGIPFWFDLEGLCSNDITGAPYRILTWHDEPDLLDLGQFVDPTLLQNDRTTFQPNLNPGSYYDPGFASMSMPTPDNYITSKAKTEMPSPNANSLHQTLQGGPNVPWSPTSSTKSPIVSPAPESREPSIGPQRHSLFSNPQLYDIKRSPIVEKWKQEAGEARQSLATARPTRKPNKEERRRCPICTKMFRRPSSLEDHLNVHSGDKPHTCPFKGCNTGFATKSNMKRHFQTHRVGQLEGYRPGQTPQVMETKPGKAPRAPTATYNSKSYHNGRFRIA